MTLPDEKDNNRPGRRVRKMTGLTSYYQVDRSDLTSISTLQLELGLRFLARQTFNIPVLVVQIERLGIRDRSTRL